MLLRLAGPLAAGRPFDGGLGADPGVVLERLGRAGEAALVSSPAHLARLPELIALESLRPATRAIFSSGGPLPLAAALEFARRFGAPPIEVYGSTETGGIGWRAPSAGGGGAPRTPLPGMALDTDAAGAPRLRPPYPASDQWPTPRHARTLLPD